MVAHYPRQHFMLNDIVSLSNRNTRLTLRNVSKGIHSLILHSNTNTLRTLRSVKQKDPKDKDAVGSPYWSKF